jgi:alpha-beta hydrolase superfamily lysophospholipase
MHHELLHAAAVTSKQFIRVPGGRHIDALSRPAVRQQVLAAIAAHL